MLVLLLLGLVTAASSVHRTVHLKHLRGAGIEETETTILLDNAVTKVDVLVQKGSTPAIVLMAPKTNSAACGSGTWPTVYVKAGQCNIVLQWYNYCAPPTLCCTYDIRFPSAVAKEWPPTYESEQLGRPGYCNVGLFFNPKGKPSGAWGVTGLPLAGPSKADPCYDKPLEREDMGNGQERISFEFRPADSDNQRACGMRVKFPKTTYVH